MTPDNVGDRLIAWSVYADSSGAISSLPDGRDGLLLSQFDQIQNTFLNVLATFQNGWGLGPAPLISPQNNVNAINAWATATNTIQINLALAELIDDSPSELAFVIAHELGHIYQYRCGVTWHLNTETDADAWGCSFRATPVMTRMLQQGPSGN